MKRLAVGLIGAVLLVAAGCARDRAVVSGDVKVAALAKRTDKCPITVLRGKALDKP